VALDFAGPDIAIRPFAPAVMFPMYLLFPPNQPRERLASAFVEVLRTEHEEVMEKLARIVPDSPSKRTRKQNAKRAKP
jgi:hypothetical protein